MKTRNLMIKLLTVVAVVALLFAGMFAFNGGNNTSVLAEDLTTFEMVSGASLKISEEGGVRFRVKMDKDTVDNVKKDNVTLSFIVSPFFNKVDEVEETKGKYYETLSQPNRAVIIEVDENKIYQDGDYYFANGCVVNISEANRKLDYTCLAVIATTVGGTTTYDYADVNGKSVEDADFSFDLARGQLYNLLNSAMFYDAINYTGAILNCVAYDWYGTEAYPIIVKDQTAYENFVSKVNGGQEFGDRTIVVNAGVNVDDNDFNAGVERPEFKTQFIVTFKAEDGSILDTQTVFGGESVVFAGETPVKAEDAGATYTFDKWVLTLENKEDATDALASVSDNLTVYPTFTASTKSYDITFVNYDGTELSVVSTKYGEMPVFDDADPTRPAEGKNVYEFAGWSPELVAVSGPATYTAKYNTLPEYSISSIYAESFTYVDGDSSAEDQAKLPDGNDRGYIAHVSSFASGMTYTNTLRGDFKAGKTYEFTVSVKILEFEPDTYWWIDQKVDGVQTPDLLGWSKGQSCVYSFSKTVEENTTEISFSYLIQRAAFEGQKFVFSINVEWEEVQTYNITWKNYDGSTISTGKVVEGEIPVYTGATPVKPADGNITYTFSGWTPTIVAATTDAVYTATFAKNGPFNAKASNSGITMVYYDKNQTITYSNDGGATTNEYTTIKDYNLYIYSDNVNNQVTYNYTLDGNFKVGTTYEISVNTIMLKTPTWGDVKYNDVAVTANVATGYTHTYKFRVVANSAEQLAFKQWVNVCIDGMFKMVIGISYEEIYPFNGTSTGNFKTEYYEKDQVISYSNDGGETTLEYTTVSDHNLYVYCDGNEHSSFTMTYTITGDYVAGNTYTISINTKMLKTAAWGDMKYNGTVVNASIATNYSHTFTLEVVADTNGKLTFTQYVDVKLSGDFRMAIGISVSEVVAE